MQQFQTGAVRDVGGKGRMDLLPMCALIRISKHMEDAIAPDPETGVPHYPERNWEEGIPIHSMLDSALRHLAKYMDGQTDEDHLCAAATNLLMAMWTEEKRPNMQDIPTRLTDGSSLASGVPGGTGAPSDNQAQGKTVEELEEPCPAWKREFGKAVCYGTKERSQCICGGNKTSCDFYPEKRGENGKP